ncbi:hypothetical protein EVAR_39300_1 [Eumeta japonica]|uniref:Uncharacterized protein n=1 Tax=Eumeta variegata TaxID=151549 RepID=A0A4C1VY24_EUMVA|nr:hypothetical protein EVAR_39300_1 [Eumeta japonica]
MKIETNKDLYRILESVVIKKSVKRLTLEAIPKPSLLYVQTDSSPINCSHFGASVAVVLPQPYVKLMLNIQIENPRCPSFLLTPQENRSTRRPRSKSEVRDYALVEKLP